jgi:crossover junction endodeoxyribonuclease RuvC
MNTSKTPTILALDLGTRTGYAHHRRLGDEEEFDWRLIYGTEDFSTKRIEGGGMRYLRFREWLRDIKISAKGIDEVYFEEVRRHIGTDASHAYGGFLGTLTSWCEENSIPYQGVPVKTIKKYVTGTGNANKQMVMDAVKAKGFEIKDDNEADALALLLYVRERMKG